MAADEQDAVNAFGWRNYARDPPALHLRQLPLQFHHDGGAVFVTAESELPGRMSHERLWWRLTGIAKELGR